ncbi:DUF3862 domain-containing protein [Paludifilum halophilum]|uniref:DUF3862 domain-containing protein n=1 Tax=Paludifilum halophilum TaxID=1642702 RepID=A0A235B5L6_9BACL|nr:DUF3862 domain-containing protein [Paludifilum halophilum]OYD07593.1 hypothetical protein CHM34_08895 [Paludifilum halophilum]
MKKFLVGCGSIFAAFVLLGACVAVIGGDSDEAEEIPPEETEQTDPDVAETPEQDENDSEEETSAEEEEEKKDSGVTLDNFQKIENGMTYDEVVEILGKEGELISEAGEGQYKTEMYQWEGDSGFGANMNVTFQNDEVQSKAQAGLE